MGTIPFVQIPSGKETFDHARAPCLKFTRVHSEARIPENGENTGNPFDRAVVLSKISLFTLVKAIHVQSKD